MAFGIKFIPLTPAAQLPTAGSRRCSLADISNTPTHLPSEEVHKAIHYFDTMMNDFIRNNSDSDCLLSLTRGSLPQINIVNDDKMEIDSGPEPSEDYDVFPDLAFLESRVDPHYFDFPLSMGDQSSTLESTDYDIGLARMVELRALLLETFPDGMPKEIDYESILADQYVPSDPLDPSFWNYFQGSLVQTEATPDEQ